MLLPTLSAGGRAGCNHVVTPNSSDPTQRAPHESRAREVTNLPESVRVTAWGWRAGGGERFAVEAGAPAAVQGRPRSAAQGRAAKRIVREKDVRNVLHGLDAGRDPGHILADLPTCRLADLPTCRPADLPTCRPADLPTCRLADLPRGSAWSAADAGSPHCLNVCRCFLPSAPSSTIDFARGMRILRAAADFFSSEPARPGRLGATSGQFCLHAAVSLRSLWRTGT